MFGLPRRPAGDSKPCTSIYLPIRVGVRGDLLDPIACTAGPQFGDDGKPKPHRGKHRTTMPGGARLRWTDKEAHA